jgi:hypothetical protein
MSTILSIPFIGDNLSSTIDNRAILPFALQNNGVTISTDILDPFGKNTGVGKFFGNPFLSILGNIFTGIGSGDFTLEMFVCPVSGDTKAVGMMSNYTIDGIIFYIETLLLSAFSAGKNKASTGTLVYNAWSHIAFVRKNGIVTFFSHGIPVLSFLLEKVFLGSTFDVGADTQYGMTASDWYISNYRLSNAALYNASFTPPVFNFYDLYYANIILNESIAATDFIAAAYDYGTSELLEKKIVQEGNVSFELHAKDPVSVSFTPKQGNVWTAATAYNVGDLVFPQSPDITPYYFVRAVAGTSGTVEPIFSVAVNDNVSTEYHIADANNDTVTRWIKSAADDDGVTGAWTLVSKLIQPITVAPIIPQ